MSVAIFIALQALPPCWADRGWSGKAAQLANVAHVIDVVSASARDPMQRAAELVTIGYWESRFCRRIQLRRRGPGHGYWQLETFMGWVDGDEDQALLMGAWNAARALERSGQCGSFPEERFTAYAGRPCVDAAYGWRTSHEREQTYYWIRNKINDQVSREATRTDTESASRAEQ